MAMPVYDPKTAGRASLRYVCSAMPASTPGGPRQAAQIDRPSKSFPVHRNARSPVADEVRQPLTRAKQARGGPAMQPDLPERARLDSARRPPSKLRLLWGVRKKLVPLLMTFLVLPFLTFAQVLKDVDRSVPYTYKNVQIVAGGFITGLVAHPAERGLRYARTDIGGAYRWDAGAERWSPLEDWLPIAERNLLGVESLAIDPADPRKLYVAAGTYLNPRVPNGAILRSGDQGRHFEMTRVPFQMGGNEDGRFAGERLQVDPNDGRRLFLATRLNGLWHSADSGVTWLPVREFPGTPLNRMGLTFVALDKASGVKGRPTPVLLVGVCDPVENLLRSDDAGRSWKPVVGGPLGVFPNHGIFAADGTLYLSYGDSPGPNGMSNGAVWAYVPRTGQWRDVTPERPSGRSRAGNGDAQAFGYGMVVVDPEHAGTVFASTLDRWHPGDTIFRTKDAGRHWVSLREGARRDATPAPWTRHEASEAPFGHWIGAAVVDPFDGNHVLYGTGETIWESHDALAAPGSIGSATEGMAGKDGEARQQGKLGAPGAQTGQGGRSPKTHWTIGAQGLEATAVLTLLSPLLPGDAGPHLYAGLGDIGCFRIDDFERSPAAGAMKHPELSNCDALALAAAKPGEMVRVGRSWTPGAPHGAVSHDGGVQWTPFLREPEGGGRGGDAAISANGKVLLWAVRGGPLAMSVDDGGHWRSLRLPASQVRLQVLADAHKPDVFWVYAPQTGELFTAAGDGSETTVTKAAPKGGTLRIAANAPETLWIGSEAGLFRSLDGGTRWTSTDTVASVIAVGFGKPRLEAAGATPVIYLVGALANTPEAHAPEKDVGRGGGIYRSLDDGASWERIDDREHRFASAEQITGDPRVFGRVYLGTNGRGVLVGDPGSK